MDVTPTQVRGVIFDKDGTLFDFATTWEAWAAAFLLRVTGGDRKQAAVIGRNIGFDLHTQSFARDSVVIAGTPIEIADALARHFPDRNRQDLLEMLNEEYWTCQFNVSKMTRTFDCILFTCLTYVFSIYSS